MDKALIKVILCCIAALCAAAVIYPIFAQTHMTNGKQPCLSNLKQIEVASEIYESDNNDSYPVAEGWMDTLLNYSMNEAHYHDRTSITKPQYGYAFRDRVMGTRENAISDPKNLILVFDSVLDGRSQHSELWSLPHQGHHRVFDSIPFDNVVMADGHVKHLNVRTKNSDPLALTSFETSLMADDAVTLKHQVNPISAKP